MTQRQAHGAMRLSIHGIFGPGERVRDGWANVYSLGIFGVWYGGVHFSHQAAIETSARVGDLTAYRIRVKSKLPDAAEAR